MKQRESDAEPAMTRPGNVAFFFWLLPIPIITLWTLWQLTQPNMNNAGYLLPAFAIVAVVAVAIAALVIGALTRTAGASLLGVVLSVPVAFVLGSVTIDQLQTHAETEPQSRTGPKYAEMANMIPILVGGNKEAIANAIRERKEFTVPWMMCVLAHDAQGPDGKVFGAVKHHAVSLQALLQITDVVVELDFAPEVAQASLSLAFQGMAKRDGLAHLPAWTKLWDKAHGFKNGKVIAFDTTYDVEQDSCNWGSTAQLANDLVSTWGDAGINAWIATGHTFVEQQRTIVLHGATEPATLENIVASGASIGAPSLPPDGPDATWTPLLSSYVELLQNTVLAKEEPQQAVKLLAAYKKLVPPSPQRGDDMHAACTRFQAAKVQSEPGLPDRQEAVIAFQKLLCTAG